MDREERKAVDRVTDDAPFDVPAFDEKEFIRKELISFKTTLVLFIVAILAAGVTFLVWQNATLNFPALVLIGLAVGLAPLPFVFKAARIDVGHWKRKEWLGTGLLYFFFWLGFLLLFVNPPFTDAAAPRVELAAVPGAQAPRGEVELGAYIADNTGLKPGSATFCVHRYTGKQAPAYENLTAAEKTACATEWNRLGEEPFWRHKSNYTAGSYVAYALGEDENGHHAVGHTTFNVSSPFVGNVGLPRDNRFVVTDDALTVRLRDEIYARVVEFSIDGGANWHPFVPHPDPARRAQNYWRTDPSYEGWTTGTHDVLIRVQVQPLYLRGEANVLRGVALDPNGPYTLTVENNLPGIGATKVPAYNEFRYLAPGSTPGFDVPLLFLGLAGLVLVGRRRRDA